MTHPCGTMLSTLLQSLAYGSSLHDQPTFQHVRYYLILQIPLQSRSVLDFASVLIIIIGSKNKLQCNNMLCIHALPQASVYTRGIFLKTIVKALKDRYTTATVKQLNRLQPDLLNDPAAYIVGMLGFTARHDKMPACPIFATEQKTT